MDMEVRAEHSRLQRAMDDNIHELYTSLTVLCPISHPHGSHAEQMATSWGRKVPSVAQVA